MLEVRPGAVAFRHELARRAVVESLPVTVRLERNARVAAALLAGPAPDLARVLHHAVEAGDDAAVVRHGPTGAREASRAGAHRQAVAAYEQVLAALRPARPRRARRAARRPRLEPLQHQPPARRRGGGRRRRRARGTARRTRRWSATSSPSRGSMAAAAARRTRWPAPAGADDLGRGGDLHPIARVNLGAVLVLVDREEEGLPHLDPGAADPELACWPATTAARPCCSWATSTGAPRCSTAWRRPASWGSTST